MESFMITIDSKPGQDHTKTESYRPKWSHTVLIKHVKSIYEVLRK